jgi:CIC family chloride channel protein
VGPLVILVPVLGAVGVTFLVTNFAPEAKGHGVPEVMDAIYYKGGVIRPVVALVKSLASAIAIGSGSSVGREGPIIQIGSALGSTLGRSSACRRASASHWSLRAQAPALRPPSILQSVA